MNLTLAERKRKDQGEISRQRGALLTMRSSPDILGSSIAPGHH